MKFHGHVKERRIGRHVPRNQQAGRFSPDLANVTKAVIKLQPDERGRNQVLLLNSRITPGDTGQQKAWCASNPWEKSGLLLIYEAVKTPKFSPRRVNKHRRAGSATGSGTRSRRPVCHLVKVFLSSLSVLCFTHPTVLWIMTLGTARNDQRNQ